MLKLGGAGAFGASPLRAPAPPPQQQQPAAAAGSPEMAPSSSMRRSLPAVAMSMPSLPTAADQPTGADDSWAAF